MSLGWFLWNLLLPSRLFAKSWTSCNQQEFQPTNRSCTLEADLISCSFAALRLTPTWNSWHLPLWTPPLWFGTSSLKYVLSFSLSRSSALDVRYLFQIKLLLAFSSSYCSSSSGSYPDSNEINAWVLELKFREDMNCVSLLYTSSSILQPCVFLNLTLVFFFLGFPAPAPTRFFSFSLFFFDFPFNH